VAGKKTAAPLKVTLPGGPTGDVAPEFAREALEGGATQATEADYAAAKASGDTQTRKEALSEKYTRDLGSAYGAAAGAGTAGLLRGATLGLSDPLLIEGARVLGGDEHANSVRQELNDLREYSPLHSGAAELGGAAIGTILGGTEGAGALRGLGAVSKLGRAVEGGVASVAGKSALGKAAALGTAGAVEGALYGAGNAVSEAALGDERLTGEKLIADMGHGAIFGGALGAAFGGVGGALARRGKASQLAEVIAEREAAGGGATAARIAEEPSGWMARLNKTAKEAANENVIKSTGGTLADVQKLRKYGDVDKAAQNILRETEAFTGKDFARASKQDIVDTAQSVLDSTNKAKSEMLSSLDAAGVATPSRQTIFQKFADHVAPYISHLDEAGNPVFHAGAADDLAPAFKFARQMEKAKVDSFQELFNESRALRKKIGFKAGSTDAKDVHLSALFDSIEGEMERAADAAALTKGEAFSQQWNALKELQQHMIFAEKTAQRGVDAGLKNNSFGLRAGVGGAVGLATGSPIGGLVTGLLGKAAKEQGDQVAASLWNKVAGLTGVQQAVARVDSQVNKGVQKLLGSAVPKETLPTLSYGADIPREIATYAAATRKEDREGYHAAATAIRSDAARPGAVAERVAEQLAPYAGVAPKATAAASATAIRGLMFLHSKLPPATNDPFSPTPQFQKPDRMTSDVEISKFMRYKEAVDNPTRVLSLIAQGKGTRQHVEALRAVYPSLYAQMQNDVNRRLMDAKRPLSYNERLKLGLFYDMPTMRAMTPAFQKNIQGTFSPPQNEPGAVPSGGPKIDIADSTMTSTDKAAYR